MELSDWYNMFDLTAFNIKGMPSVFIYVIAFFLVLYIVSCIVKKLTRVTILGVILAIIFGVPIFDHVLNFVKELLIK